MAVAPEIIPNPDPSSLTTAQLREAISNLHSIINAELRAVGTRLDAIDKATEVFNENLTRVPTDTDKQIQHLKELHGERFNSVSGELRALADGITKQFAERDVRTDAAAIGTSKAVDAALQAQKEAAGAQNEANAAAITKSEANTTKLIDGIIALLNSTVKATDEKISDLKGRLDRGEGVIRGGGEVRTERRLDMGTVISIISMAIAAAAVVVAVIVHHL